MRNLLLFTALVFFLGACNRENGLIISNEKVICSIDRSTTEGQLREIKKQLWEKKKIQFDVNEINLDRNKLINKIAISVDCHDGFKGSAQMTFSDDKTKLNFYRVYNKNESSPFGIGGLPDED